jgi:hypothetical protein
MSDLDANFDNQLAAFMGGEKVEEVKEPETVETVSQEETIQEPEKTAEPTNFDKAKSMGWNPNKEEYEAKTGRKWSNEDDYLKIRSLSDENHKLKQQQAKRDKEFDRRLRNVEQPIANIAQNEHKQRLDNVSLSLKQAAIDQDFDAIDALLAERDKLMKAEPIAKQEEPLAIDDTNDDGETQKPAWTYSETKDQADDIVDEWVSKNKWYEETSDDIREEAKALEIYHQKIFPKKTLKECLAYVSEKILEKHPDLGIYTAKLKSPDVNPRTSERPKANTVSESSLSNKDREIYNRLVRDGVLKTSAAKSAFIKDALGA